MFKFLAKNILLSAVGFLFLPLFAAADSDEFYDSGWMDLNSNYGSTSSVCVDGRRIVGDNCAASGIPTDCTVVDYNSIAKVDLYLDMPFDYSTECRVEIKANYSGPSEPNEIIKFKANGIVGTVADTQETGRVISWVVNDKTGDWKDDFTFRKGWNRVTFYSPGWCTNDAAGDQVVLGYPDQPGKNGIRIRCYGGENKELPNLPDEPEKPLPAPDCPYDDKPLKSNQFLFTFKPVRTDPLLTKLVAHKDFGKEAATNENSAVPAGRYKVSLAAFDAYTERPLPHSLNQDKEQFLLHFKRGNKVLAVSGATDDLKDGTVSAEWHGVVNEELVVPEGVTAITAYHADYYNPRNAQSVQPVCALLEKLDEPVCGNGVVEEGEECDDGNSSNADRCSNICTKTVCGDGIIQNPNGRGQFEQCDRGDRVDGDGCSSLCKIERPTIVGSCGSAVNQASCGAPESGLCADGAAGTPRYNPATNKWEWTCGTSELCSTTKDCTYREVRP